MTLKGAMQLAGSGPPLCSEATEHLTGCHGRCLKRGLLSNEAIHRVPRGAQLMPVFVEDPRLGRVATGQPNLLTPSLGWAWVSPCCGK